MDAIARGMEIYLLTFRRLTAEGILSCVWESNPPEETSASSSSLNISSSSDPPQDTSENKQPCTVGAAYVLEHSTNPGYLKVLAGQIQDIINATLN